MNKLYFCWNFFLIDWRHKNLKNTVDLLLFYGEHFYWFSEKDSSKSKKTQQKKQQQKNKKTLISQQTYLFMWVTDILKFYEVLFCSYCKDLFCL